MAIPYSICLWRKGISPTKHLNKSITCELYLTYYLNVKYRTAPRAEHQHYSIYLIVIRARPVRLLRYTVVMLGGEQGSHASSVVRKHACWAVRRGAWGDSIRTPARMFPLRIRSRAIFRLCKFLDIRYSRIPNAALVQQPDKSTHRGRDIFADTPAPVSFIPPILLDLNETPRHFSGQNFRFPPVEV